MFRMISTILLLLLIAFAGIKAQQPSTPIDGATDVSQGISSVSWTGFEDGNTFAPGYGFLLREEIATLGAPFVQNSSSIGAGTHTVSLTSTLAHNTTYYWWVRDQDTSGIGDPGYWRGPYSFKIEKVQTTSPVDGATSVSGGTGLNITWSDFKGAFDDVTDGNYDFELHSNGTYTGLLESFSDQASASIVLTTSLAYSTTYYWRVRDTDSDGNGVDDGAGDDGPWQEYSFTTGAAPVLYPPNNGTDIPIDFGTGSILPSVGTAPYDIQLSTNVDFSGTLLLDIVDNPTISVAFPSPLEFNTTYFWRVRDVSDGAWTVYTFRTIEDFVPILASPVNLDGNVEPINVPFTWYFNADYNYEIRFYLVYGKDSNLTGADTVKNIFSLGNSGLYHMKMDPGTQYYWRVISIKNSEMVAFSSINSFVTRGAASKPEIAYPKNETTVYLTSPILYWYTSSFHVYNDYEVEWDDNSGFSSPDTIKNIHQVFTYLTGLTGGQTYYWRVRSYNEGIDTSAWSETVSFNTFDAVEASIPVPAYPTGGVVVYNKFPKLYWMLNGPSQGLTYEVYYRDHADGDLSDPADTSDVTTKLITGISQLYVTLYDGIIGGHTYSWRVKSWNGVSYSEISDEEIFSIYDFSADLIPILSWPIGGNLVFSTDVNFAWHVEGPSLGITYEIDYAEDVNPGIGDDVDGTPELTGLTSNLLTITLSAGKSYEWRVRVTGETTWSNVETFQVIGAGGANVPVLNWPVGGTTVWSASQDLSWNLIGGGSPTYEIQVFTDASLTTHFGASPYTAVSSSPLIISGLSAGATYYWRVRVEPSEPWSNVEVFTVFAGINPAIPLAASPSNGVELTGNKATLSWFSPTFLDYKPKYEVEYADNREMANSTVVENLEAPNFQTNGLNAGTYYWRTRSINTKDEYSGYSEIAEFKVKGVTSTDDISALPQNYELSQNYPNPFNPSTQIKFSLPEANHVTLKIYNMLGQEIRTLINNQSNAGVYTVNWNGRDNYGHKVSSGAYIYQIVSGSFVQTKKMILLK